MGGGARAPEELETLFEDAFVLRDAEAVARLFEAGAMLVVGGGLPQARGHREIARLATRAWDLQPSYLADPERVLQVGDTALILGRRAVNVVRRGNDGSWRYIIAFLDLET
jgi:ketosteroid isomerase-like protein